MGIFEKIFSRKKEPEPVKAPEVLQPVPTKYERHKVAGVTHYMDNIMKFAKNNPIYSYDLNKILAKKLDEQKIYKYVFNPLNIDLIPEPTNPDDPKAIKVMANGLHIGYIKKGSCGHVLNLLREDRILKIEGKIEGGEYRYWTKYRNEGNSIIEMRKHKMREYENNIGVEITIYEK